MSSFLVNIINSIDSYLWRYGFRIENIRLILRVLVLFNIIALVVGLMLLWYTKLVIAFALASCLSTLNFLAMAKNVLANFPLDSSSKMSSTVIYSSFMRMFILIALSLVAILIAGFSPLAWFAGLGVPILCMPLIFMKK